MINIKYLTSHLVGEYAVRKLKHLRRRQKRKKKNTSKEISPGINNYFKTKSLKKKFHSKFKT